MFEKLFSANAELHAMTRLYDVGNYCVQPDCSHPYRMDAIVKAAAELSGAEMALLEIGERQGESLAVTFMKGNVPSQAIALARATDVHSAGETPWHAAMRTKRRVVIDDVDQEGISIGLACSAVLTGESIRSLQVTPLVDSSGRLIGLLSLFYLHKHVTRPRELRISDLLIRQASDYLERRKAEAEVIESEERFRAFTSATTDAVYRMNSDWTEMRYLRGREFIADTWQADRSWLDHYIPWRERQRVSEAVRVAIEAGDVFELEHRVIRVDGTEGWAFSRAIPVKDAKGNVVEWFGAASDIGKRIEAEVALQASENRLRILIEQLPAGVGVHDQTGVWTLRNSCMEEMVPQGIPSVFPQRVPEWQSWDEDGNPVGPDRWPGKRALRGETVMPGIEMLHTDSVGRQRWLRVSSAPMIIESGRVIEACCVIQDVTIIKTIEKTLKDSDADKDRALELLRHSLKERITPVLALIEVLRDSASGDSEVGQRLHNIAALLDEMHSLLRSTAGHHG